MERIRALINKLHKQSGDNADASAMMITVQLLHFELAQMTSSAPREMGTGKVAVVLPSAGKVIYSPGDTMVPTPGDSAVPNGVAAVTTFSPSPSREQYGPIINKVEKAAVPPEARKTDQSGWLFDPVQEIPTLSHQNEFKEMNDAFGQFGSSVNDTLKTGNTELASVLTDAPVRDLKKAIGINDRFVFLSELFRGDEAMYERSIKTINNFRIYPEAEYWMERELKVKLGWDEKKEVVKQFSQLVKRRFS